MTFAQFVEQAHRTDAASFWGYVRARRDTKPAPTIPDLPSVTPEALHGLAQTVRFSAADLEAGYRALCAVSGVAPAWPPRVYP